MIHPVIFYTPLVCFYLIIGGIIYWVIAGFLKERDTKHPELFAFEDDIGVFVIYRHLKEQFDEDPSVIHYSGCHEREMVTRYQRYLRKKSNEERA